MSKVPKVVPVPKQGESNGSQDVMTASNRVRCNNVNLDNDGLVINKGEFVLFMAEIINCSAQTQSRTARIKIIVKATEKYLGIKGLLWETVIVNPLKLHLAMINLMLLIILQWNARSLIANGQEFKRSVDKLKEKPNIICVQET